MVATKPDGIITILLIEDIVGIRENVKKLLSFESDFEVIGMAGTGYDGIAKAKQLQPDIVITDINMPDIDGFHVTTQIIVALPETGIIIMTAQDDASYVRLAMIAGAKAFITKPPTPDELYQTIRAVYNRARAPELPSPLFHPNSPPSSEHGENRAGHVITVYSPQGGAGCTTLATNLASALNRENSRVLLVDANLQFGDVGVFLNLDARTSLMDLVEDVDDLDTDYLENVVTTHPSGLQVLLGPARPEQAEKALTNPETVSKIIGKIRWKYDYTVIDTSLHLDEMALSLMDIATRIILISSPSLTSVKNMRFVLDLFDQLGYTGDKIMLVLNRVSENPNMRKLIITPDKVSLFLKRSVDAVIPTDEYLMLDAIRKGVPFIALERDRTKSPVKELMALSDQLFAALPPDSRAASPVQKNQKTTARNASRK